jgi:hypothetical protein
MRPVLRVLPGMQAEAARVFEKLIARTTFTGSGL